MLSYRPNGRRRPRILKMRPKQIYKGQVVTDGGVVVVVVMMMMAKYYRLQSQEPD